MENNACVCSLWMVILLICKLFTFKRHARRKEVLDARSNDHFFISCVWDVATTTLRQKVLFFGDLQDQNKPLFSALDS